MRLLIARARQVDFWSLEKTDGVAEEAFPTRITVELDGSTTTIEHWITPSPRFSAMLRTIRRLTGWQQHETCSGNGWVQRWMPFGDGMPSYGWTSRR